MPDLTGWKRMAEFGEKQQLYQWPEELKQHRLIFKQWVGAVCCSCFFRGWANLDQSIGSQERLSGLSTSYRRQALSRVRMSLHIHAPSPLVWYSNTTGTSLLVHYGRLNAIAQLLRLSTPHNDLPINSTAVPPGPLTPDTSAFVA
jgi:hypothetical protein